jgi:hypothetical protein
MRSVLLSCVLFFCAVDATRAEDPIYFADARLKTAVEDTLWITDPTPTDMLGLVELVCANTPGLGPPITDLTGLEYATNLQALNLRSHEIGDISALSGLTGLHTVALMNNRIASISPLAGLSQLETLDLELNQVDSISVLSGLSHLRVVGLHRNFIKDISPLANLTTLTWLDLRLNPLNADAYAVYLPQIQTNNPDITLLYYPPFTGRLVLSATPGGSIIRPGEGEFFFGFYESVWLEAKPDPGFVFVQWLGSLTSTENPVQITMDDEYMIQANFARPCTVLYVDDDAPADPAPRDATTSDPQEDGTAEHPFDQIQEAIQMAGEGATILVGAGTYRENLDLLGKNIRLIGADPNAPAGTPYPVIAAAGSGPVVRFGNHEGPDCALTGFVISGCQGAPAGAILCTGSSPTIAHCLIVGNRISDPNGAAVYCVDSRAVLRNCTIADNYAGNRGAAVTLIDSDVVITNSILWGNSPCEILALGTSQPSSRYCDVQGWWPDIGNLHAESLFARHGRWIDPEDPEQLLDFSDARAVWAAGDYHLLSQAGRWDPDMQAWVQDDASSPCLDAGGPTSPVGNEPTPHAGRINLGVYGGTGEASKSCMTLRQSQIDVSSQNRHARCLNSASLAKDVKANLYCRRTRTYGTDGMKTWAWFNVA